MRASLPTAKARGQDGKGRPMKQPPLIDSLGRSILDHHREGQIASTGTSDLAARATPVPDGKCSPLDRVWISHGWGPVL